MVMHRGTPTYNLWTGLQQILTHGLITLLAVAVAFSLPGIANYILNEWWPEVQNNANLLLATEVALASVLALLFNLAKIAWDHRQRVLTARLASLVHARNSGSSWWSRRRERALIRQLPAPRDAFVLTLTGYDTFVADDSLLRGAIGKAYEIRVMLVNPVGKALRERADSLPPEITVLTLHTEIEATIGYLSGLRKFGKMVNLKFYDEEPFWKLIVLGDYEAAERAFRRAVLAHPRSAAAHNNLAQTLADLDRHDEALAEARVAVGLGGPQEDTSIRTLDAIVSRTGRGEQEWHR